MFPLPKDVVQQLKDGANGPIDGPFILDMIIPLTRRQAVARAFRLGYKLPWKLGRHKDYYTCRHFDVVTRLCGVYDQRPAMCRDYPYENACDHPDCCYKAPKKTQSRWRAYRRRRDRAAA